MKVNMKLISTSLMVAAAFALTGAACDDESCPIGSTENPEFIEDDPITDTNVKCIIDSEDECTDDSGCEGGICILDTTNTCQAIDNSCLSSLDDSVAETAGSTVLVVLEEIDFDSETDLALGGANAGKSYGNNAESNFGYCAGSATNFAHGWRVQYYDPTGNFPTTIAGFGNTGDSTNTAGTDFASIIIKESGDSNNGQSPNGYTLETGDGTAGTFVFYLCLGEDADETWAIQYISGTAAEHSNAACFAIGEETHPCTANDNSCPS